jgi:hypothetical protein
VAKTGDVDFLEPRNVPILIEFAREHIGRESVFAKRLGIHMEFVNPIFSADAWWLRIPSHRNPRPKEHPAVVQARS